MVAELLASVPLNRVLLLEEWSRLWFLSTKRMRHGREPSRTPSRGLCGTTQKDSYLELEFVETGFDSRSESSSGSEAVTGEASENGSRGPMFQGNLSGSGSRRVSSGGQILHSEVVLSLGYRCGKAEMKALLPRNSFTLLVMNSEAPT